MAELKMTNTDAFRELDSSFRFERLGSNYKMYYHDVVIDKESENEADIMAFMYKFAGTSNSFQRFGVYSFRRNVKFVDNTAKNKKAVKEINSMIKELVETKGKDLVHSDLSEVNELVESLEFYNPFQTVDGKDGVISIPDNIEIIGVTPKLNIGFRDQPSTNTHLRYTAKSYKASNYIKNDKGQYVVSEQGESLAYLSRELANDKEYDEIIDLYDAAQINDDFAKDIKNVVFNNAICVVLKESLK